ncbi:protein of unknown function [Paenibacillus alvei]|uniref:Uncharacterized protein n=1 Tax=Paenibacillus alvei TaxID=44250 RepID=A0A383RJ72_PAEAL|nr:protein of unknown function [Paenibacillus alvei]
MRKVCSNPSKKCRNTNRKRRGVTVESFYELVMDTHTRKPTYYKDVDISKLM